MIRMRPYTDPLLQLCIINSALRPMLVDVVITSCTRNFYLTCKHGNVLCTFKKKKKHISCILSHLLRLIPTKMFMSNAKYGFTSHTDIVLCLR